MFGLKVCLVFLAANAIQAGLVAPTHSKVQHENPDLRVVGGDEVKPPHSAPFVVYIQPINKTLKPATCAAALISPDFLLTAAHCLHKKISVHILLGAHDVVKRDTAVEVLFVDVKDLRPHTSFDPLTYRNDIGLIKLPSSVTQTNAIQYATLPTSGSQNYVGKMTTAFGWGETEVEDLSTVLRSVDTPVLNSNSCFYRSKNLICTSGAGKKGTCGGDSGSPLVLKGTKTVIGITSYGPEDCTAGDPSYYTDVSKYLDWIKNNMK